MDRIVVCECLCLLKWVVDVNSEYNKMIKLQLTFNIEEEDRQIQIICQEDVETSSA